MKKYNNSRVWAIFLVTIMTTSAFVGFSITARGTADGDDLNSSIITIGDISEGLHKQQLNEDAVKIDDANYMDDPIPFSQPPQNEIMETWAHNFDSDVVDQWPSVPPWNYGYTGAGQAVSFPTDNFENDVVGNNPDSPPWVTSDGTTPLLHWAENFESYTLGEDLTGGVITGDYGYFGNFIAGSTLTAQTPPAGTPPGTIIPGFTSGAVCSYFVSTGASYWGPAGIGEGAWPGTTTHAFCGGWIYMTALIRFDILLYDLGGGGTAIEAALQNDGTLRHWPGNVYTQVAGVTWTTNTWHELFIEYWETNRTYRIFWDGVQRTTNVAWIGQLNIDSMIWYGQAGENVYVDNFFHMDAPSGTANAVSVSNAQFHSGAQSVYIDQNAVAAPNIAMTTALFSTPMAGTGSCDYWLRTDSVSADTNGALAEIIDQTGGGVIQIRANAGQFQYNDGGVWTNAEGFAVNMWYNFIISFDTVAKTYILTLGPNVYGGAFARQSGTLAGIRFGGTAGTESEHYIDDVTASCAGADANITVSNFVSHSAPNSLRFQEYNSIDYGYVGADNFGLRAGAVGTFSFWFYNTENGGGQQWQMSDANGGANITIISLGLNLATLQANPGVVQFVNNDGAGFWVVDGPTYNANEWHQITIEYNCEEMSVSGSTGSYYYRWDGGATVGPYGMMDPAAFFGMFICFGGAPDTYGDFFYDDFSLVMSANPTAPTNCWAKIQESTASVLYANYTTDLDNPLEGIVTGTEANTHGTGTENIQEFAINDPPTWTNNTVVQDFPVQGTVFNTYTNIDEIFPPDTLTEEITEVIGTGGSTYINYSTDQDIPWDGVVTGTEANTHGAGSEDIQEVRYGGDIWNNYTTQADVVWGHGTVTGTEADTHTIDAVTQNIQEVMTPGLGVVINEVCTNLDWVELRNYGASPVVMTGWTFYADEYPVQGGITYSIPAGFTLNAGAFVQIHDGAGTNDADDLYTNSNIFWNSPPDDTSMTSITDGGGTVIDYVEWGAAGDPPYGGTYPKESWSGTITQAAGQDCIYRNSDQDNNGAIDWGIGTEAAVPSTPKALNPGQTGVAQPTYSLEYRWQTQNISTNATTITLYITARTNTGADDTFTFSVSPDNATWTTTTIIVNSDVMTTYAATIPSTLSGFCYVRVVDNNTIIDITSADTIFVDAIRIEFYWNIPYWWTVKHQWRTESILVGADNITLYVTARTNTGADDTFTFSYATNVAGPYTTTSIVINSDVLAIYSAVVPVMSGQIYLMVYDDNRADPVQVDTIYIDTIRIERQMGMSIEHRWQTDAISMNAIKLELYITARTNTGTDDTFTFGYSSVLTGPYTPIITVNSDVMTTYSVYLPVMNGQIYFDVIDDVTWDFVQQDTIFIDTITLETTISGAIVSTQVATADNPDHGIVTGTYLMTTSIPPDGSAQQIDEIALSKKFKSSPTPAYTPSVVSSIDSAGCKSYDVDRFTENSQAPPNSLTAFSTDAQSQPSFSRRKLSTSTPLSPGPQPTPGATIISEDFSTPWVPDPDGDYDAPPGWDIDGVCVGQNAPFLTHYWSQFNDGETGMATSNSTPDAAGAWWSNGAGETVGTLQNEWLKTPVMDLSGFMNTQLYFNAIWYYMNGADEHFWLKVSPDGGTTWDTIGCMPHDPMFDIPGATGGWLGANWVCYEMYDPSASIFPIDLSAYDFLPAVQIAWHVDYAGTGNRGIVAIDDVHVEAEAAGNSLAHVWRMEPQPVGSTTRLLSVTARTDVATNEAFSFGWSQNIAGPFTPIITIDSDTFVTKYATIPTGFSGDLYINVIDNTGADFDPINISSVFVDCIRVFNDNTIWPEYSADHQWRTQAIPIGAQTLTFQVTACTNPGADDTFTFGYSTAMVGPYITLANTTVATDVMTTYTCPLPYTLNGPLYFNVLDNNSDWGHFAAYSIDTIYIDDIRVSYYSPGGTLIEEYVIGDRPGHGNVTGTYAMTQSNPPDTVEQQITEVNATIYPPNLPSGASEPSPLYPGPGPEPKAQVYYTTRVAFNDDGGADLPIEDFEEGNIGAGAVAGMGAPLDEFTNSAYFLPGEIQPGIRLQDNPGPDATAGLAIAGAGFSGNLNIIVCSNTFADSLDMIFYNNNVYAVGLDLQSYFSASTPTISIYTTGDVLLDTVTAPASNAGTFWGVISDELITRINIFDAANTDGGDNIAFGEAKEKAFSLAHAWEMDLQPNMLTRTLHVNAHTNAGANDNFSIGYVSDYVDLQDDKSWNWLLNVTSDIPTTYTTSVPVTFNDEFYIIAWDSNRKDEGATTNADTLFVDMIYIQSFKSNSSTSVDIHWNLSTDDYAGIWQANYSVDQDNPVEGTVTNTCTNLDEISPPDGLTEDIQESALGVADTWQNYTAVSDIDVRGLRTGAYTNIDEISPPDGLTENIQETTSNMYSNWTVVSDIDVEGIRTGTYTNIDEINPPDGLLESIREVGNVTTNKTYDYNTYGGTDKIAYHKTVNSPGVYTFNWNFESTTPWTNFVAANYTNVANDDGLVVEYTQNAQAKFFTFNINVTEDEVNVTSLYVYAHCSKSLAAGTMYLYAWDHDARTWVMFNTTTAITQTYWNRSLTAPLGRWIGNTNKTVRLGIYRSDPGGVTANDTTNVDCIRLSVNSTTINTLEQRWMTQIIPAPATSLTLYVTGNHSTGSNDTFTIGYSTVAGGPYTPVITINSATMNTYSAALPTSLSGQLYLNVIDTNILDKTGQDTVYFDTIRIYYTLGYGLEQRWMTQNVPAGSTSLTLYVRANYSTGSNDDFTIGYSTVAGGPYTPVITINSATMNTYSAALPTMLSGQFYLNVIDSTPADYSGQDTVYIDLIRVEDFVNGGGKYSNWSVMSDIDVEGTRVGTNQNVDEMTPPDGLLESITEVGGVTTNKTYDYKTMFDGSTDKYANRKWIENGTVTLTNWNMATGTWGNLYDWEYFYLMNDDANSIGWSAGASHFWAFTVNITEYEASVNSLYVYTHCNKNNTTTTLSFFAWDYDAASWVQLESTTGNAQNYWNTSLPAPVGRWIGDGNGTVRLGLFKADPLWGANGSYSETLWINYINLSVNATTPYSLEQRWMTQSIPAPASSVTLFATANYSAGSNDDFIIGYSTVVGGPYTPVITINSATMATYSAALPTSLSGQFYLSVVDSNTVDKTGKDTAYIDTIRIEFAPQYTLEHRWRTQAIAPYARSLSLYITARTNAGADDSFTFGYSTTLAGPYTPTTIVVNSNVMNTYSFELPTSLSGQIYINVIDNTIADPGQRDTIYVDTITLAYTGYVSGPGENDIVAYNIYRADQEHGDTIWGPYEFIGSTPPFTDIYVDAGEGLDMVNQAWYYVEAEDASGQVNASGYFSKLNFAPVTSNVLANGVNPRLTVSPGLQMITIVATVYDDSSQFEAIPKMDYAEMYIDIDPGQGLGVPLQPTDLLWNNITETITGLLTYTFVPGIYEVYVRTAETINGTVIYGDVSNVTIECIDQAPIANANLDQTVPQHTNVMFDGSLSTDDVGIIGYWWNFTDVTPQSVSGEFANYIFDNEGVYTVTLEIRDTIGQGDTDEMIVNVTDGDLPIACAGPDQNQLKGLLTSFDGTGSYDLGHDIPPDRGIVNWTWTFTHNATPETLWGATPTYTFWTPGVYTVTLVVTDASSWTGTDTVDINVQDYFNIDITQAAATDNWILVSFPSKVMGDPLTILVDALNEGAGLVQWDIIQRYESNPMAPQPGWLTTSTFKPPVLNDFTYVDNTMSFWIHITVYGDGNLTVVGDLPITGEVYNIQLYTGWNLVGYPCMTSQDVMTLIGGMLFNIIQTEVYDQVDPYRTRWQDPWDPFYFLSPGQGIWIEVSADEIWAITCP
jgi:hypothetical protein